jgi:hypothetical protein
MHGSRAARLTGAILFDARDFEDVGIEEFAGSEGNNAFERKNPGDLACHEQIARSPGKGPAEHHPKVSWIWS